MSYEFLNERAVGSVKQKHENIWLFDSFIIHLQKIKERFITHDKIYVK